MIVIVISSSLLLGFWVHWLIEVEKQKIEYIEPLSSAKTYANQFELGVINHGAMVSKVIMIFFNNIPTKIYDAYTSTRESRIAWDEEGNPYVIVNPGELVWIRGFSPKKLVERTIYTVRIITMKGNWFQYPVKAAISPLNTTILAINTGIKDPRNPERRIVLFAPILTNNRGVPMTVYSIKVYDETLSNLIFEMNYDPPLLLQPGESWRPSSWREMMKAGLEPGDYYVRVDFRVGNYSDYLLSMMTVSRKAITVYVLKIEEHGTINEPYPSWTVDLDYMVSRISSLADIEFIDEMQRYIWIIEGNEELPEPFILINLHSEPIPLPWPEKPELVDVDERKVYWHYWFRSLGDFIEAHRAVWVNPSGYPFWGVANKPLARQFNQQQGSWTCRWGGTFLFKPTPWTTCWGEMINYRSLDYPDPPSRLTLEGGATNLYPEPGVSNQFRGAYEGGAYCGHPNNPEIHYYDVTYNGFPVVTGGLGDHCTWTWRYDIRALEPVEEFNEFFEEFGLSLPEETKGWDVPDVAGVPNVIEYYETIDTNPHGKRVPTVYAVEQGDGYLLVVGIPPESTELSVDMSLFLSIHIYLFKILLPQYGLA